LLVRPARRSAPCEASCRAGGIQIVLQCLTCGSSIGTAQSHAAHPDFLTYRSSTRRSPYRAAMLCIRSPSSFASARLSCRCCVRSAPASPRRRPVGHGRPFHRRRRDYSSIAAAPRLVAAIQARDQGIVCEGEPVTVPGIEIQRLEDGYLVLIDRKTAFVFMTEAVCRANNKGAA
jgi:hypothetical protein